MNLNDEILVRRSAGHLRSEQIRHPGGLVGGVLLDDDHVGGVGCSQRGDEHHAGIAGGVHDRADDIGRPGGRVIGHLDELRLVQEVASHYASTRCLNASASATLPSVRLWTRKPTCPLAAYSSLSRCSETPTRSPM